MTTSIDKPFKTYDELLDLLISRNVIIEDRDFAKNCLCNFSYYSIINGFKNLYPVDTNERFIYPVSFNDFYILYNVETFLNSLILKYIIAIEKSFKSKISYVISMNYGVQTDLNDYTNINSSDYLCKSNYKNTSQSQNILKGIKEKVIDSKHDSIRHYQNNHNHIPCWILINAIPFGMAIKWYEILIPKDKQNVCDQMIKDYPLTDDEKKEFFKKSLVIIRKYRNNIAHGHKIFIKSIKEELPKKQVLIISSNLITDKDYRAGIGHNDIFAVIIILSTLLDKTYSILFLSEVINLLNSFNIYTFSMRKSLLEMLSLPSDFLKKLEAMKEDKQKI